MKIQSRYKRGLVEGKGFKHTLSRLQEAWLNSILEDRLRCSTGITNVQGHSTKLALAGDIKTTMPAHRQALLFMIINFYFDASW